MIGRSTALLLALALVAPTPAQAESGTLVLLDAGRAPRQRITVRYPETGSPPVVLRMSQTMGGSAAFFDSNASIVMTLQAGPQQKGRWPVRADVHGIDLGRSGELRRISALLVGLSGNATVDAAGTWSEAKLSFRGQPLQLEGAGPFGQLDRLLNFAPSAFPAEPVGLGARWRVTTELAELVVTLTAVHANAVELEFEGVVRAAPGLPGLPTPATTDGRYRVSLTEPSLESEANTKTTTDRGELTTTLRIQRLPPDFDVQGRFVTWSADVPDQLECPPDSRSRIVPHRFELGEIDFEGVGWRCETGDGRAQGPTVVWNEEGYRTLTGAYRNDRRHGVWRAFLRGVPLLELKYDNGALMAGRHLVRDRHYYWHQPELNEVYVSEADLEPVRVADRAVAIFDDDVLVAKKLFDSPDRSSTLVFAADTLRARPRYGPMLPLPKPAVRFASDLDERGSGSLVVTFANGSRSEQRFDAAGNGTLELFDPEGRRRLECPLHARLRHGPQTRYDREGRKVATLTYAFGIPHGAGARFDTEGGAQSKATFEQGVLVAGDWPDYHPPDRNRSMADKAEEYRRYEPPNEEEMTIARYARMRAAEREQQRVQQPNGDAGDPQHGEVAAEEPASNDKGDQPALETVRILEPEWGTTSAELKVDAEGKAHGAATFTYPSGRLFARGSYRNGFRDGPWTLNYDNDAGLAVSLSSEWSARGP